MVSLGETFHFHPKSEDTIVNPASEELRHVCGIEGVISGSIPSSNATFGEIF